MYNLTFIFYSSNIIIMSIVDNYELYTKIIEITLIISEWGEILMAFHL